MSEEENGPEHDPSDENFQFDWDLDGLAYTLHRATQAYPPREVVNELWTAIAEGRASDTTCLAWLKHIAKEVVSELIEGYDSFDRQRGSKALKALGLYGVTQKHSRTKEIVRFLANFDDEDGRKGHVTPKQVFVLLYPRWAVTCPPKSGPF